MIYCRCRNCEKPYIETNATGYCSEQCLRTKARKLGWRKKSLKSEVQVLKQARQYGSIEIEVYRISLGGWGFIPLRKIEGSWPDKATIFTKKEATEIKKALASVGFPGLEIKRVQ